MIAFWVVVVVVVVWGVSRLFPAQPPVGDARSILDARLAAGDIDPATYRAVREELAAQSATTTGGRP
jgi:putative membrane protein